MIKSIEQKDKKIKSLQDQAELDQEKIDRLKAQLAGMYVW